MLSISTLSALKNCRIQEDRLYFPGVDVDELAELRHCLSSLLFARQIPFFKPIAVTITSGNETTIVVDKLDCLSSDWLGTTEKFRDLIIMPSDEEIINNVKGCWELRKGISDIREVTLPKSVRNIKLSNVVYLSSVAGSTKFDDMVYQTDNNKISVIRGQLDFGNNTYKVRPLIRNTPAPVEIEQRGIIMRLTVVMGMGADVVSYHDIQKTVGNTGKSYYPIRQVYSLQNYVTIMTVRPGDNYLRLMYMADIDTGVLEQIFRELGVLLEASIHFDSEVTDIMSTPGGIFMSGDTSKFKEVGKKLCILKSSLRAQRTITG